MWVFERLATQNITGCIGGDAHALRCASEGIPDSIPAAAGVLLMLLVVASAHKDLSRRRLGRRWPTILTATTYTSLLFTGNGAVIVGAVRDEDRVLCRWCVSLCVFDGGGCSGLASIFCPLSPWYSSGSCGDGCGSCDCAACSEKWKIR